MSGYTIDGQVVGTGSVPAGGTNGDTLGFDGGVPAWRDAGAERTAISTYSIAQVDALVAGVSPTTLAAQAIAVTNSRRGPVAMGVWSDANYIAPLVAPAGAAQPSMTRTSSGVITVYSNQAGAYGAAHLVASHDVGGTRGYLIGIDGSDLTIYSFSDTVPIFFTNAVSTTGFHSVAWSIDGTGLVRWRLDGGAVQTPVATPAFTARNGDDVRIGRGVFNGVSGTIPLAYVALWASILSDADLLTLSSTPGAGAPVLPSAPAWEWAAAAYMGVQRVDLVSGTYAVVGSPSIWMP